MITTCLLAILIILGLLAGWLAVQHLARTFSARHPELGPHAADQAGCGMFCFCKNREPCPRKKLKARHIHPSIPQENFNLSDSTSQNEKL